MDEPGLRERKKVRTRRRIEAAALELFARDGFDATTVEQIAAAADISARTFFHYFPTKEDVVLADYAERLGRLLAVLEGRPPDEAPWESLRQALRAVASDQEEKLASMQARLAIMGRAPTVAARSLLIQAGWERSLAALLARRSAQRGGEGDGDEDGQLLGGLLAATALAAMRASIQMWLRSPGTDLPATVDRCFALLGDGLDRIG